MSRSHVLAGAARAASRLPCRLTFALVPACDASPPRLAPSRAISRPLVSRLLMPCCAHAPRIVTALCAAAAPCAPQQWRRTLTNCVAAPHAISCCARLSNGAGCTLRAVSPRCTPSHHHAVQLALTPCRSPFATLFELSQWRFEPLLPVLRHVLSVPSRHPLSAILLPARLVVALWALATAHVLATAQAVHPLALSRRPIRHMAAHAPRHHAAGPSNAPAMLARVAVMRPNSVVSWPAVTRRPREPTMHARAAVPWPVALRCPPAPSVAALALPSARPRTVVTRRARRHCLCATPCRLCALLPRIVFGRRRLVPPRRHNAVTCLLSPSHRRACTPPRPLRAVVLGSPRHAGLAGFAGLTLFALSCTRTLAHSLRCRAGMPSLRSSSLFAPSHCCCTSTHPHLVSRQRPALLAPSRPCVVTASCPPAALHAPSSCRHGARPCPSHACLGSPCLCRARVLVVFCSSPHALVALFSCHHIVAFSHHRVVPFSCPRTHTVAPVRPRRAVAPC
ncbi:hypothetical protein DENSPDRAFT_885842 [Dentipellis sp. KUC8613]|nr:hypothetical protein DENSPDRAFT_885842 [Dentipellis sp. KUC8613]